MSSKGRACQSVTSAQCTRSDMQLPAFTPAPFPYSVHTHPQASRFTECPTPAPLPPAPLPPAPLRTNPLPPAPLQTLPKTLLPNTLPPPFPHYYPQTHTLLSPLLTSSLTTSSGAMLLPSNTNSWWRVQGGGGVVSVCVGELLCLWVSVLRADTQVPLLLRLLHTPLPTPTPFAARTNVGVPMWISHTSFHCGPAVCSMVLLLCCCRPAVMRQ